MDDLPKRGPVADRTRRRPTARSDDRAMPVRRRPARRAARRAVGPPAEANVRPSTARAAGRGHARRQTRAGGRARKLRTDSTAARRGRSIGSRRRRAMTVTQPRRRDAPAPPLPQPRRRGDRTRATRRATPSVPRRRQVAARCGRRLEIVRHARVAQDRLDAEEHRRTAQSSDRRRRGADRPPSHSAGTATAEIARQPGIGHRHSGSADRRSIERPASTRIRRSTTSRAGRDCSAPSHAASRRAPQRRCRANSRRQQRRQQRRRRSSPSSDVGADLVDAR